MAQSRQVHGLHGHFYKVWRADKGEWSRTHRQGFFGWGGHHLGPFLWEPETWGTESETFHTACMPTELTDDSNLQ